jgi:hypothetical protein
MFGAGVAFTALEAQAEPVPVALTQVGNPSWRLTDFHLFTAPGGNDDLIDTTVEAVLPRHFPTYVPHTNHATEVSEGLAAVGITSRTTFSVDEISGSPLAVHLAFVRMPGPGAPTGVTRDFPAGGPIIPNSIYPLTEDGGLYLNGALIDPEFDAVRQPSPTGVGFSHTTIVITMHEGFFPAGINPVGSYVYRESQRDALGNGWDFAVPFTVVAALAIPEPSTWALFAVGLAGLAVAARRRPGR